MFEAAYGMITGGKLDILVNNANFNRAGAIQNMTEEDIRISTEGPYISQVNCCVHVAKHMIENHSGKIINIGTEASRKVSNPGLALYAAAKGGVLSLTRTLASELAPYGIIVNGVAPGVMMHPRLRRYFENPSDDPRMKAVRKSIVESAQETLAQRVSIPWEVANTVAYLCTDACSYICGYFENPSDDPRMKYERRRYYRSVTWRFLKDTKQRGGSKNCFRLFVFIL